MGKVTHHENLVGSFWWKDIIKLVNNFRGVTTVHMGNGSTFSFWHDNWWLDGSFQPAKERFPRLFSFAKMDSMSAAQVYGVQDLYSLFELPLSQLAHEELTKLQSIMANHQLQEENDRWTYCRGRLIPRQSFISTSILI